MEGGGAWGCRNLGWGSDGVRGEEGEGAQGMLETRAGGCRKWGKRMLDGENNGEKDAGGGKADVRNGGMREPGVRGCWSPGYRGAGAQGVLEPRAAPIA